MTADEQIIQNLKASGLYDVFKAQVVAKDMTASDAHVSTAIGNETEPMVGDQPVSSLFQMPIVDVTDEEEQEDDEERAREEAEAAAAANAETTATLIGKGEFQMDIAISKIAPEQRMVFGWASVSAIDGKNIIDKQGDIIPVDAIEPAAYEFVLYSREHGDMHTVRGSGRLVESCVFTPEKEALGIVAKDEQGRTIHGWWTGFHVQSDDVWAAHKRGERPEFSIGGRSGSDPYDKKDAAAPDVNAQGEAIMAKIEALQAEAKALFAKK